MVNFNDIPLMSAYGRFLYAQDVLP